MQGLCSEANLFTPLSDDIPNRRFVIVAEIIADKCLGNSQYFRRRWCICHGWSRKRNRAQMGTPLGWQWSMSRGSRAGPPLRLMHMCDGWWRLRRSSPARKRKGDGIHFHNDEMRRVYTRQTDFWSRIYTVRERDYGNGQTTDRPTSRLDLQASSSHMDKEINRSGRNREKDCLKA